MRKIHISDRFRQTMNNSSICGIRSFFHILIINIRVHVSSRIVITHPIDPGYKMFVTKGTILITNGSPAAQ